jgi:hypothetical protein
MAERQFHQRMLMFSEIQGEFVNIYWKNYWVTLAKSLSLTQSASIPLIQFMKC